MAGLINKINLAAFTIILTVYISCAELNSEKCDHSFGDPKWNYSHYFYNKTHTLQAGTSKLEVYLPRESGEMISFVCVRVPSHAVNTSASFAAMFDRLTVSTAQPVGADLDVLVTAKKHPY